MSEPSKVWLRRRVPAGAPGRVVTDADIDVLARGPCDVFKPDGKLLLAFRPRAVDEKLARAARDAFEPIRNATTQNRGIAAGEGRGKRIRKDGVVSNTTIAAPVRSAIVGYFDRYPRFPYCRQTAFNAHHRELFDGGVLPFVQAVARVYEHAVPERFAAQDAVARVTRPEWVIAGTPFTTLTINHDWSTRMHQDAGDLPEGFGCISAIRTGRFDGCILTFPAFRIGADLHTGDVIFFDSHEWHGNTPMRKAEPGAERCSIVHYFRTKMAECGSPAEELERAKQLRGAIDFDAEDDAEDDAERDPAYNEAGD